MSEAQGLHVIIPSATDSSGMLKDCFEYRHINQMPLGTMTIIECLIHDLRRITHKDGRFKVKGVHLIVADNQEDAYRNIIEPMWSEEMSLTRQERFEDKGIISAVEKVLEKAAYILEGNEQLPFLVIHGNTLFHDDFLNELLKQAYKQWTRDPGGKWLVLGLVDCLHCSPKYQDIWMHDLYDFERNRCGYFVVPENVLMARTKRTGKFNYVSAEDILDAISYPAYPALHTREGQAMLCQTGIMIFSPSAWKCLVKSKQKDTHGFYSVTHVIRRARIERKDIQIIGVVSNIDEHWQDVTYPWEYLRTNNYMCNHTVAQSLAGSGGLVHPYLEDAGYAVVTKTEDLIRLFGGQTRETGQVPASGVGSSKPGGRKRREDRPDWYQDSQLRNRFLNEYDQTSEWGVHEDVVIEGALVVPDPNSKVWTDTKEQPRIFIGGGARIRGCCVLKNGCRISSNSIVNSSVLGENVYVGHFCLIAHSVIMDATKILPHCTIPYSIVGRKVIFGGHSLIGCERLDWSKRLRRHLDLDSARFSALSTHGDVAHGALLYDRVRFWEPELGALEFQPSIAFGTYISDHYFLRYTDRFGAIIGDGTMIGMNVFIQPGRRIGRDCVVCPGVEVSKNLPPRTIARMQVQEKTSWER
jgi:NDP-sugar pyrophosphorylase family protein